MHIASCSLILIMVGTIVFNALIIRIVLQVRLLRQNLHNLLVLNLCVTDLCAAAFSMTFALISVFDGGWFLTTHHAICQVITAEGIKDNV